MSVQLETTDHPYLPAYFGVSCGFLSPVDIIAAGTFTGTAISSGTAVLSSAVGGVARLSGAATTDNSGYQLQSHPSFTLALGKKIEFRAKFNPSEATEQDLLIGFATIDTNVHSTLPTNIAALYKADDATALRLYIVAAGVVALDATLATLAAATDYEVAVQFEMDATTAAKGIARVALKVGTAAPVEQMFSFTAGPTGVMALTAAQLSGTASGTVYTDFDYLAARQQR